MFCGFRRQKNDGDFALQNHPQFHKKGSFRLRESHGFINEKCQKKNMEDEDSAVRTKCRSSGVSPG